jgi:hypothetical protein
MDRAQVAELEPLARTCVRAQLEDRPAALIENWDAITSRWSDEGAYVAVQMWLETVRVGEGYPFLPPPRFYGPTLERCTDPACDRDHDVSRYINQMLAAHLNRDRDTFDALWLAANAELVPKVVDTLTLRAARALIQLRNRTWVTPSAASPSEPTDPDRTEPG